MTTPKSRNTHFAFPSFVRTMWVSDTARSAWERRAVQFAEAWRQIEWLTVLEGVRPCALVFLSEQELRTLTAVLREFALEIATLSDICPARNGQRLAPLRVAIGRKRDLSQMQVAWDAGDHEMIGRLLGYPACCRDFFISVFIRQSLNDATWEMAQRTIADGLARSSIELMGMPLLNPFWISNGVRLCPLLPCRMSCSHALSLAEQFVEIGRRFGYGTEMEDALTILSWPVEWSCLHGIAEISTPILKVSTNTNPTPSRCLIRFVGSGYPAEGATGTQFPFRPGRSTTYIPRPTTC